MLDSHAQDGYSVRFDEKELNNLGPLLDAFDPEVSRRTSTASSEFSWLPCAFKFSRFPTIAANTHLYLFTASSANEEKDAGRQAVRAEAQRLWWPDKPSPTEYWRRWNPFTASQYGALIPATWTRNQR